MFLNKKMVMYLSGRWMFPKIKEGANFNWAVVNFPYGKTPQLCDVSGWSVSKNSKHKSSAKKFIQFLSREKSYEYFTQTGLIVPAEVKASMILENDSHNEKAFLGNIKRLRNTPVNKEYRKIVDNINRQAF